MADSPYVVEVTAETFQSIVIEGSSRQPVLVDFWASWCGPCQVLTPLLTRLAEQHGGKFILAKVDTEAQQALAMQFGIRSIPTCKLFKDGQPVDEFMGALPESEITAFLDRHIPRESDHLIAQAEQLWSTGDAPGALALATRAAEEDPDNPRSVIALARFQAANNEQFAAQQTLDRLPADVQLSGEVKALRSQLTFDATAGNAPPRAELEAALAANENDSAARFQLAARLVMDNDLESALDHLLTLMQKDRQYGDDAARKAMVQVFDMLGDDPRVPRYRTRMMNLLY
jgi:putative thioredoxin